MGLTQMKQKTIYLTIDDGSSPFTREKVDLLLEMNIPAVWYLRGEFIDKHFDDAVYVIEKGFVVGNHTYTHPYFSEISLAAAKEEILRTEELINKAFVAAKKDRGSKLFRFPFLDKGGIHLQELQNFLLNENFVRADFHGVTYKYFINDNLDKEIDAPWTFDGREYALFEDSLKEKYGLFEADDFKRIMERNDPEKGFGLRNPDSNDIVLFHDFYQTPELFEPMVRHLHSFGHRFALPTLEGSKMGVI